MLDNPALNTCMSTLCETLLGEKLLLNGPPTYWLGNEQHMQHVLTKIQDLLFRDIDSIGQLYDPRLMTQAELDTLRNKLHDAPQRYVAQERIDRSVAPGFAGTQRTSYQVTLRLYMVRQPSPETADIDDISTTSEISSASSSARQNLQYQAMPGALCLLDSATDGRRPSFDSLIGSKDTWVIAEGSVKPTTLLGGVRRDSDFAVVDGELPSRVAENLFWMGRNAERCESSVRLLRAVFQVLEYSDIADSQPPSAVLGALLRATSKASATLPGFIGRGGAQRMRNPQRELLSLLHDPDRQGTLPANLSQLQRSAGTVRDRISDELLQVLHRLDDAYKSLVTEDSKTLFSDNSSSLVAVRRQLDSILMSLSTFAGLAHENFTHGDGWRFLMLGRRLERVNNTSTIINTMLSQHRDDLPIQESLLRLFDSTMTYRSRYRSQYDVRLVLQLLLLDEYNPRSIAYQFAEIEKTVADLPGRRTLPQTDPLLRLIVSGLSRVRLAETDSLLEAKRDSRQTLAKFLTVLPQIADNMAEVLSGSYFAHVETSQQLSDLEANTKKQKSTTSSANDNTAGDQS